VTGPVLGIDLGTTNSVVAVAEQGFARVLRDAEGNALIPSVVAFHPSGDVLVGFAARERRLLDARNTVYSVKRLIGRPFHSEEVTRARERFPFELAEGPTGGVVVEVRGETYSLPEISAFVLRKVRDVAERALGVECTRCVVTVPANFNELQRSATKAACRIAGLDALRILNEPTAAALAYGCARGARERVAVYDFGGGTFDLTILELAGDVFEVVATAGDTFLGGDDIDVLIADAMTAQALRQHRFDAKADPQAYERLRAAAEWAKCQLSTELEVHLRVEELAYEAGGKPIDLVYTLDRASLDRMIRPLVARTFDVCEEAMRLAGLRPTQLDTVVLVGGSTRIPLVRQMVQDYFGRVPRAHIDPDLVVAQGAALQGLALAALPSGGRRRATTQVGRLALKKVTADLGPDAGKVGRNTGVREEVMAAHAVARQPAFAPREQGPVGPVDPRREDAPLADASLFDDVGLDAKTPPSRRPPPAVPPPDVDLLPGSEDPTRVVRSPYSDVPPGPDPGGRSPRAPAAPPPLPTPAGDVLIGGSVALRGSKPPPLVEATRPAVARPAPPAPPNSRAATERGDGTLRFGSGAADPGVPAAPAAGSGPGRRAPPSSAVPLTSGDARADPPSSGGMDLGPSAPAASAPADTTGAGSPALPPPVPPPPLPAFSTRAPSVPPLPTTVPRTPPAGGVADGPAAGGARVAPPPLLLDVTPLSLGIETVGGYCEHVIKRNAAIPVEQTRVFTTGQDGQTAVSVRICQGESRKLEENQALGVVELSGLRAAPRGEVKIGVTFVLDQDGTLGVTAKDLETGRSETVHVRLVGGMADAQVDELAARHAQRTVR
jgi:molecular chaperone DnaK